MLPAKLQPFCLRPQCVKRITVFPNISAAVTFNSGWKSHWIQMAYQFLASRPMESQWHTKHDDVIKWKHFPHYWPFVWGIHQPPMNSLQERQWWSFDVFFDLCLNKRLSKHSGGWWVEMPSRSLWRHCMLCTVSIDFNHNFFICQLLNLWAKHKYTFYIWLAMNITVNKIMNSAVWKSQLTHLPLVLWKDSQTYEQVKFMLNCRCPLQLTKKLFRNYNNGVIYTMVSIILCARVEHKPERLK